MRYLSHLKAVTLLFVLIGVFSCSGGSGDAPVPQPTPVDTTNTTGDNTSGNDMPVNTDGTSSGSSITLGWESPVRKSDEECITLSGFVLHYGVDSGVYTDTVDLSISNGDVSCSQTDFDNGCGVAVMTCNYTTEVLQTGSWYFAVKSYAQAGAVGHFSNEVSTTIQ